MLHTLSHIHTHFVLLLPMAEKHIDWESIILKYIKLLFTSLALWAQSLQTSKTSPEFQVVMQCPYCCKTMRPYVNNVTGKMPQDMIPLKLLFLEPVFYKSMWRTGNTWLPLNTVPACYRQLFESGLEGNLKDECNEGNHKDVNMPTLVRNVLLKLPGWFS